MKQAMSELESHFCESIDSQCEREGFKIKLKSLGRT